MIFTAIFAILTVLVFVLFAIRFKRYKVLEDNRCEAIEKYTARMALDISEIKDHLDTIVATDMESMRLEIEHMKPEAKENNDFQRSYMEGLENIWSFTGRLKPESEER